MSSKKWLETAKKQGYSHVIEVRNKDGIPMAIFTKSLSERKEKVQSIQDSGAIFKGKLEVFVTGVYSVEAYEQG